MRITLNLTESQWGELAYALESKARLVERGDFGPADGDFDPATWSAELDAIHRVVTTALDEKGVAY